MHMLYKIVSIMKNPTGRFWVVGWFLLVLYIFIELFGDHYWGNQSWRYVNGAPWLVYLGISTVLSGVMFWYAGRAKISLFERWTLALGTILALTIVFYFSALRINAWTASETAATHYILQESLHLIPDNRELPELYFEDHIEFWQSRKPGESYNILVIRGWLGFHQYDIRIFHDDYRNFFSTFENR